MKALKKHQLIVDMSAKGVRKLGPLSTNVEEKVVFTFSVKPENWRTKKTPKKLLLYRMFATVGREGVWVCENVGT